MNLHYHFVVVHNKTINSSWINNWIVTMITWKFDTYITVHLQQLASKFIAVAEKFEDGVYAIIQNCSYTNFPVHAMD